MVLKALGGNSPVAHPLVAGLLPANYHPPWAILEIKGFSIHLCFYCTVKNNMSKLLADVRADHA